MKINGSLLSYARPAASGGGQPPLPASVASSIKDVYLRNRLPAHMAGGALMGAGLATVAGLEGGAVMSAAGSGAFAGFVANSPKTAVCMAGGALVGAAVAGLAGLQGAAMMGAVSTGTFIGWFVS